LGGGCELAMMCDILIASETAKFGQPEINLGVMAGIGGTQRLPKSVGKYKAMDMHLTGRYMDAQEAEKVGLVSRVFPEKDFEIKIIEIAKKISEKSMSSIIAIKESINFSYESNLSSGIVFERRKFHSLFSTEDQKEGMAAFVEKRTPKFSDR
jgi:enoyl-CoA hydratase